MTLITIVQYFDAILTEHLNKNLLAKPVSDFKTYEPEVTAIRQG